MEKTPAQKVSQSQRIRDRAYRLGYTGISRRGHWAFIDTRTGKPIRGMEWVTAEEADDTLGQRLQARQVVPASRAAAV